MKTSSSLLRQVAIRSLIGTAVGALLLSPVVGAVSLPGHGRGADAAQAATTQRDANICNRVNNFGQQVITNITTRISKLDSDASTDAAKRQQKEQSFDAKVAADRSHWDSVRDQNFAKLQSEATTDAQKQAVATFQQTVLAAVATRRAAVDQARDTFRNTVAQDVAARQTARAQAINTFQAAVNAAISQAQASCSGSGTTGARTTFVAALRTARQNLQAALAAIPKLGPEVSQAAQTRNQAVKQADQTFQQTIQQATQTLKAALGQTGSGTSS